MQQYYSKKIIDHFLHPKNWGKIKNADGVGDTLNLRCGDIMKVYIKVGKKKGKEIIQDAAFETLGCAHAISSSDLICELIKGKTIEKALKISYKDIAKELGSLPPQKIHCAHLAEQGLKMAIEDYKKKREIK